MTDGALEAALYASRRSKRGHRRIEEPDWASIHRELKRKHVALLILWDEYIAANSEGYSYSRFCELYRAFEKTQSVTMRQTHAAGERPIPLAACCAAITTSALPSAPRPRLPGLGPPMKISSAQAYGLGLRSEGASAYAALKPSGAMDTFCADDQRFGPRRPARSRQFRR